MVVTSHLTMRVHFDQILSSSASSIYALRKLRSHGLQPLQLHLVARTTTVASLLYASPAWWGFASAEEIARLERLIARLRHGGYLPQNSPTFEALARTTDHQLVFLSINTNVSKLTINDPHDDKKCYSVSIVIYVETDTQIF